MTISARAAAVNPSATLAISARAKALAAAGEPVISLAAGEPDFETPAHVVEAASLALRNGATRYTPVAGMVSLREAIAQDSEAARGQPVRISEVVVTAGAKQALYNLFQVLLNPGDEVLLPSPSWVSYAPQIGLAQGRAVPVACAATDRFFPSVEALEACRTPRTKVLVLNTPSNPTGLMPTHAQLTAVTRYAAEHGLWLISDEIYRRICFSDGPGFLSPAQVDGVNLERLCIVDGVSKSHAMTGWRLGWLLAPPVVAAAAARFQSHQSSNAAAVSQHAALAALTGDQTFVGEMVQALHRRRDLLLARVAAIPGLEVHRPDGAFYAFLDVRGVLNEGEDDFGFCTALLDGERLALVPGSAFCAPGFVRLSIAASDALISAACDRIERFVAERQA
jgi:aspartate aminotransferase